MTSTRGAHVLLMLTVCAVTLWATRAAALPAAGDGRDLWLILAPDDEAFRIMHRTADDPPNTYRLAGRLAGQPAPAGLAAAPDVLWLVTNNLWVRSIRVLSPTDPRLPRYDQPRTHKALPSAGVALRSLAASDTGPWALVRIDDPDTLRQIDGPIAPPPRDDQDASPDPPDTADTQPPPDAAAAPAVADDDAAGGEVDALVPVDRLLRLAPAGWTPVSLPADWPGDARGWLVMVRPDNTHPDLVTIDSNASRITVYRRADDDWRAQSYDVPIADEVQFTSLHGQLIYARREQEAADLRVVLMLLRPDGAFPIGAIEVAGAQREDWQVVAAEDSIALVTIGSAADGIPAHQWTRVLLTGQVDQTTTPLTHDRSTQVEAEVQQMIMVLVMGVALVVVFSIWRNPQWTKLKLPDTLVPADLARRGMAAAIDFSPGLIVALLVFDLSLREFFERWPGWNGQWSDPLPAALATVVFVVHTMLTELFTARSVGKRLMGMRIVAVDGQPPHLWQILFRNLLKFVDVGGWFVMLIFPVLSPAHQRLGDVLARTVVVAAAPPRDESKDTTGADDDA